MSAIDTAKDHLLRFCQSKEQRVYAFKGPWGVGKSYLIRKLIRENNVYLPDHPSYVSVFGLSTVREVQDRLNGSLEQRRSILGQRVAHMGGKVTTKVLSVLSNAKSSIPFVPVQLPDLSTALFWHIAKREGLLIVFDDLERANPALQFDQLLGLVSSIAENSAAKILLVFNEEELKGEAPKIFARFREKVIDGEFTFCPSIADLISAFLDKKSLSKAVISCLEVKGGPNIRLIQRINRGVRAFCEAMDGIKLRYDEAVLNQMAKIIWHFHVSPVQFKDAVSLATSLWGDFVKESEEEDAAADKEAVRLARVVGLSPTSFDKLMLAYLHDGYFSDELLREFSEEETTRLRDDELQGQVDAVVRLFNANFLASADTIATAAERVLDGHCEELNLSQMKMLTDYLVAFGRPAELWWRRHVKAVVATRSEDGCKAYLLAVFDHEARALIQSRLDTLVEPFDARAVVLKIGAYEGWQRGDLHKLNALDASYYKEWFQQADGNLFAALQGFLEQFANAADGTPESQIHKKIVGVLTEMAGENEANRLRVEYILRLSVG